ncbi:MAG: Type 1 glutamine amidotransferase-like domain-containing protein [Dysgonamonadaceae bacterium]|nr:Type 1 glutamine amidotransferase-like domain-containing protein [Dysgonamonadaceae bacterium]
MPPKATPPAEQLLHSLLRIHVPPGYLSYFDLYEVVEKIECYELILHEKAELIPGVLEGKNAVLKTFAALNIVDFYPVPHHTNFPFKKAVEKIIIKYGAELKLYPISNKQARLVDGNTVEVKE